MKTENDLLCDAEKIKKQLLECTSAANNNERWSLQQQYQIVCGLTLTNFLDKALESGIERDLWNVGFRSTINELQADTRNSQKNDSDFKGSDYLNWFLDAASGFYIQLLNRICSLNAIDFVFRRKDSLLGLNFCGQSTLNKSNQKSNASKNALYLCQYCLIHLGDLARYKHQAKQAETFYKHAVSVAPTTGQPYNQLALLEAGRGNKLSAVFLYIRSVCVHAPFPVAPSNLSQTLSKIIAKRSQDGVTPSNEDETSSCDRMTKEEYLNLFLYFHSVLLVKGDIEEANQCMSKLSSALSMLVATTTFTRSALVQIFCINLFSYNFFSNKIIIKLDESKKDEVFVDPKEHPGALETLENMMIFMLSALLLPIHTMRDPEVVLTYSAFPTILLMMNWIFHEGLHNCSAIKKKQQIWPSLCSLLNLVQNNVNNFNAEEYSSRALPEDKDLQGFQPLAKIMSKYKYHDEYPQLTPEVISLLRATRLTILAKNFAKPSLEGGQLIKVEEKEGGLLVFEAVFKHFPPAQEVINLQRLTMQPTGKGKDCRAIKREKIGILKPQGSLEKYKETKDASSSKQFKQSVNISKV